MTTWTVTTEELDEDERKHRQARRVVSPEDYAAARRAAIESYEQASKNLAQARAVLDSFSTPQEETK